MKKFIYIVAGVLILFSCKKEEEFSTTPSIEFKSISPGTVLELSDRVKITLKYKDGDGDLGQNEADVDNLFVTDNRTGLVYKYRIQELAPSGSSIAIEGNLTIDVGVLTITDGSDKQSADFSVYMLDRAGNQSNTITTSTISVSKN